jgi:peptidoglycan hydrolase-like protein with peptidoglycan-binding domain
MAPGARITWYQSSASIPGVREALTPDDQGNWVDRNGRRYSVKDMPGAGGMGILQLTIVDADPRALAADARSWIYIDPQSGTLQSTSAAGYVGNIEGLGEYWIHPSKLAATQDMSGGGSVIRRMQYPLNGRNYNAIVFNTSSGTSFQRYVYDLETGLLLVATSSSVGSPTMVANPDGTSSPGAGTTMITYSCLLDVRQTRLPWAADPLPEWMRRNGRLDYRGTYLTSIPGVPEMPADFVTSYQLGPSTDRSVRARQTSSLSYAYQSAPNESVVDRVVGSAMVGALFIHPQTLRAMRPNEVLDEDPVRKARTFFAGVQGNAAVVVEQSANEMTSLFYDLQSGVLAAIRFEQQQPVAKITVQAQLAAMP